MRALICGGRDFTDSRKFQRCMEQMEEQYGPFTCIVQGGARGADRLAADYAVQMLVPCEEYPADWTTHGRAAGPIRNQQMLVEGKPGIVFAFEGGRGTASMVSLAKAAGVRVVEF